MSYLVLARKFRPQSFAEVTGQDQVTKTLGNSIKRGKIAHAYLFAGPRGVGKTSIARIFAKSLNCSKGPTVTPCTECANCRDITHGTSLAVREIDGASHNSVDNVRDLIDSFRALPPPGSHFKIYIIDEVHMLSIAAFNALLKSLEEPPPNTIFILATTEAHKIPETVISRCQRHDLRALTQEEVEQRLSFICKEEKIEIEPAAMRLIARLSEGSMRDAQSLLDRVHSFCDEAITSTEASKVLGVVERTMLFRLSEQVFNRDSAAALVTLSEGFSRGLDPALFLKEFVAHWRELLIAKTAGDKTLTQLGVAAPDRSELLRQVSGLSVQDLQDLVQLAREGSDQAIRSAYPRYTLESLIVRMALRQPVKEIADLVAILKNAVNAAPASARATSMSSPKTDHKVEARVVSGAHESARGGAVSRGASQASIPSGNNPGPLKSRPEMALLTGNRGGGAGGLITPSLNESNDEFFVDGATALAREPVPQTHDHGNWQDFVHFAAASSTSRMLVEQLRRLSALEFSRGSFVARGTEFSVGYVTKADMRAKLQELLHAFAPQVEWKIQIQVGDSKATAKGANSSLAEAGSLKHTEDQLREQQRREKTEAISNHPSIKSIQKLFPGSKIETIKLKDEDK